MSILSNGGPGCRAGTHGDLDLQHFVQQLAVRLTGWKRRHFSSASIQPEAEQIRSSPSRTDCCGSSKPRRNSMVRKIRVMKCVTGTHSRLPTFRINDDGVQVFPRSSSGRGEVATGSDRRERTPRDGSRSALGLDDMLGGGIPAGYSMLLAGPSGSGKSMLAAEFISEGARHDEPGIIAVFEKRPNEYSQDSPMGRRFDQFVRERKVAILQTRPLDLSIDEMLNEIIETVHRLNARRVVIDSLSGFELALAPTFREDFRESLYRMVTVLTGMGITMIDSGVADSYWICASARRPILTDA